jgi:general secretion pathway protein L
MNAKTWGLDIGSTGIKAVEVTRTLRGFRVSNHGLFPLPAKEKGDHRERVLQALRQVLPKLEDRGEGLVYSFPSRQTMIHRIPLPFADRKKNRQVVKYEVEPLLPLAADQVIVDFYSPGKNSGQEKTLVFAVRKGDLGDHLALLKEAGLDPESVVPEALALFALARTLGKTSAGGGALLDLGDEKATLVLWQNDRLVLARSIPLAVSAGQQPAAHDLSRLAEEVRRTLLSAGYGPENRMVEEIFLTGGNSLPPGVEKDLADLLPAPVSPLDLEEVSGEVPKEIRPALAVALGAALGGAAGEEVNLRREEFASSQKAQRARGRMKILVSYAAILAVLGVTAFVLNYSLKERRYQGLRTEIRKEFTQALPEVKRVVNELQQMKARVQEERLKLAALGGGGGSGSPLEILRGLSMVVDPSMKVRVTELVIDPEAVEVNGEADSFDTVNQLKSRLERSPGFKEVQLKTARASSLENVVEFKLQMKRGG